MILTNSIDNGLDNNVIERYMRLCEKIDIIGKIHDDILHGKFNKEILITGNYAYDKNGIECDPLSHKAKEYDILGLLAKHCDIFGGPKYGEIRDILTHHANQEKYRKLLETELNKYVSITDLNDKHPEVLLQFLSEIIVYLIQEDEINEVLGVFLISHESPIKKAVDAVFAHNRAPEWLTYLSINKYNKETAKILNKEFVVLATARTYNIANYSSTPKDMSYIENCFFTIKLSDIQVLEGYFEDWQKILIKYWRPGCITYVFS